MGTIQHLLGIGFQNLNWYQTALRAVIVYITTLVMVRLGEKRFLGRSTAFDVVVGIILGSLVSSAINSTEDILPTLLAGFVLIGLHWLFAVITFHSGYLDKFLKGKHHPLVENGKIVWAAMKKAHITKEDLLQQMRTKAQTEDLGEVKKAFFERSGDISVIKSAQKLSILEIKVEDGVQTVRVVVESW